MKSKRNKTIDLTVEQGAGYLARCAAPGGEYLDKTILGDTFAALPLLPEACAALVIADPPYNMHKDFGGTAFRGMSDGAYLDYTRRWLSLVRPRMTDTASIYVCCDWRCSGVVGAALSELFTVRSRITWQREKGRGAAKNWKNAMEDIWFATVSGDYTFHLDAVKVRRRVLAPYRAEGEPKDWTESPDGLRYRDTCPGNFWDDLTVPYWSMAENTAHPTQKPEKLLAKLILASSDPGDTVLDPFLGSGSTSVTAKKLGRRWIGIEQNPRYCVWAERRLELAETDRRIQGFEDGVFRERNFPGASATSFRD